MVYTPSNIQPQLIFQLYLHPLLPWHFTGCSFLKLPCCFIPRFFILLFFIKILFFKPFLTNSCSFSKTQFNANFSRKIPMIHPFSFPISNWATYFSIRMCASIPHCTKYAVVLTPSDRILVFFQCLSVTYSSVQDSLKLRGIYYSLLKWTKINFINPRRRVLNLSECKSPQGCISKMHVLRPCSSRFWCSRSGLEFENKYSQQIPYALIPEVIFYNNKEW